MPRSAMPYLPAFATVAFLLACPLVAAGTLQDPEAHDATGDVVIYPGAKSSGPLADAVDLDAMWVHDETLDTVQVSLHVKDLAFLPPASPVTSAAVQYAVDLDTSRLARACEDWGAVELRLTYWPTSTPGVASGEWTFSGRVRDAKCGGPDTDLVGRVDVASDTLTIEVPRALLGSPQQDDTLTLVRADAWQSIDWPASDSDIWAPEYKQGDAARVYRFTLGEAQVEVGNLTAVVTQDGTASKGPGGASEAGSGSGSGSGGNGGEGGQGSGSGASSATSAPAAPNDKAQGAVAAPAKDQQRAVAPKGSPAPVAALLGVVALAAAAVRRRLP